MKDNEEIKAGDVLICISNEGLSSIGDRRVIMGLTEKSINMFGSTTSWVSRTDFRWNNYIHEPCTEIPKEVIDFIEVCEKVWDNNIIIRKSIAKRLNK